jgi:hypothetical protein
VDGKKDSGGEIEAGQINEKRASEPENGGHHTQFTDILTLRVQTLGSSFAECPIELFPFYQAVQSIYQV